ncbi:hypothetical protein AGMMS49579_21820 [Spirochaetia bacterium]|nr:hypothetical protein AGMMS49579_21820 [Spirochaetia bacterium]
MKKKTMVILLMTIAMVGLVVSLTASGEAESSAPSMQPKPAVGSAVQNTASAFEYKPEDSDTAWSQNAAQITLNGSSAQISGSGAAVNGKTVTISQAGDYVLSGTWNDGQILVNAGKNALVRIVLNGVQLSSSTGTPLYMKQANKTVLILPQGTRNVITDAVSYVFPAGTDEPDAAIFAADNLSITGTGALTVNGRYRNGIASKDKLVISGGNISVTAVNDGLRGRDALAILDGTLVINAGNDGIKSNNDKDPAKGFIALDGGTYTLKTGADAVQAETGLTITGGNYSITTGGGSANAPVPPPQMGGGGGRGGFAPRPASTAAEDSDSRKGFKSGTFLLISGGSFTVDAEDDAFHSNGNVTVSGGSFSIQTGDDAFHADSALRIDDGLIVAHKCYEGLEGATIDINGGNITLTSSDDAINASGGVDGGSANDRFATSNKTPYIRITGGTIEALSIGDGIDANGDVFLDGGLVKLSGPSMGMQGAIDFDRNFVISGGRLITAGTSLPPASQSTQMSLLVSYTSQVAVGSVISLAEANGRELLTYTSRTACTASAFTSPDLAAGKTYTLLIDGKKRADIKLGGMVTMVSENGGAYAAGRGGGGRGGRW